MKVTASSSSPVVQFNQEGISVRTIWKDICTAMFLGFILPGFLLNMLYHFDKKEDILPQVDGEKTAEQRGVFPIRLRTPDGMVMEEELDDYLVGVVLAEMPASFALEALKAQAVAARTYTVKAAITGGKHGDGSVCTNPGCCQAYIDADEYLLRGGTEEGIDKVGQAVYETSGDVLVYEGELIEATYFSCSGGSTEDAVAVWGTDYAYLRAVDSPGEEQAAYYENWEAFTPQELQNRLGVTLEGTPENWFGQASYTDGGGVSELTVGDKTFSGTQLRRILGLKSTAFEVSVSDGKILFKTRGYGHRVGMSQYGADAMAVTGCGYEDILRHYYPGTELTMLDSILK